MANHYSASRSAKNPFKMGDIVRFKTDAGSASLIRRFGGGEHKVLGVSELYVNLTDGLSGLFHSRFELVKRPAADEVKVGTYIISLQKPDGTLLPAAKPVRYGTDAQADKIAKLMAKKHGGRFVVFKAVGEYEMPVAEPVYRAL